MSPRRNVHRRTNSTGSNPDGAPAEAAVELPPPPSLDQAKAYARSLLLRQAEGNDRPGELFPLYTALRNFDRLGTDISQYMHFMYWGARLFFALFMLNLSNLVINWEGGQLQQDFNVRGLIVALLTWHTLGNSAIDGVLRTGAHSYVVIEFFTAGILVCYLFYLRGRFDEIHTRIRNSDGGQLLTAADFTVMVSHVPESWGSQQLRDFFEKFGEVVHVGFSLNYRGLIKRIQQAKSLREVHTNNCLALLNLMGKLGRKEQILRARRAARASLAAVEENNRVIKRLMKERYQGTGYAFVTFNKYQVAQAVLAELPKRLQGHKMQTRVSYLFGGHMRVRRAPEPEDVIWENLQYSKRERVLRQVLSTSIATLLVVVGTFAIFVANLYIAPGMRIEVTSFITFLGCYLGSVIVLVFGHLVVFFTVPLLVKHLERPHTNAELEMSMMLKLTAFMILNTMITAILFIFPAAHTNLHKTPNYHFSPGWYVTGGQILLMSILGDLVVVNLGLELFRPGDLIRRFYARRAKTQQQMNELYACPGSQILPYRTCIMCKCMVVGTMFSFAMPIMQIVIAVNMWMGHWVDRYTYLRRVTMPPASHELSQMSVILTYIFPIAILLHTTMAPFFLGHICHREVVTDDWLQWILGDTTNTDLTAARVADFLAENYQHNSSNYYGCDVVLDHPASQCVALPSTYDRAGDVVQSIVNLLATDTQLKAQVAAEAGGADISADAPRVDLTCWMRNSTEGSVCVEASASGGTCTSPLEGSGAHNFLVVNAIIWGLPTLFFMFSNSDLFKKREMRRRLERRLKILNTSAHLDLWRFLVQRDIRDPKIKPAPPNAQVRAAKGSSDPAPTPTGYAPDGSLASPRSGKKPLREALSQKLANLRKDKSGAMADPSSGVDPKSPAPAGANPNQLSAHALMYLPPLTVHLLNSYYDNANTSNKLLSSYLKHYVANPLQQSQDEPDEEEKGILASMRERGLSLTEGLMPEGMSEGVRRASQTLTDGCGTVVGGVVSVGAGGLKMGAAGAKAGAKGVVGAGGRVLEASRSVGGGLIGGLEGAASAVGDRVHLQDNVKKLRAQLNALEMQLSHIPLPSRPSLRPRKASLSESVDDGNDSADDGSPEGSPEGAPADGQRIGSSPEQTPMVSASSSVSVTPAGSQPSSNSPSDNGEEEGTESEEGSFVKAKEAVDVSALEVAVYEEEEDEAASEAASEEEEGNVVDAELAAAEQELQQRIRNSRAAAERDEPRDTSESPIKMV